MVDEERNRAIEEVLRGVLGDRRMLVCDVRRAVRVVLGAYRRRELRAAAFRLGRCP